MRWFQSLRRRLQSVGGKDSGNAALSEELQFHLERQMEENMAQGMSPERARAAARESFGNVTVTVEESYEARGVAWLDDLGQDVRYGLRTLVKDRAFTVVTMLTLALGIGACTAIFSLVNAVLIRSLPYGGADRLAYLYTPSPHIKLPPEVFTPSVADFADLQKGNRSFESMTLFSQRTFDLFLGDQPRRIGAAAVDASFFHVLQAVPQFGRTFDEKELHAGGGSVVISDALWHTAFGGRQDILNSVLHLDGKPYQIVGVMPPGFEYPHKSEILYGNSRIDTTELWLPYIPQGQEKTNRDISSNTALVRLKPDVTIEQAQAEMAAVMKRIGPLHTWMSDGTALIEPFRGTVVGKVRPLMLLLLGAVGCVLLIACGNAANLMLARAANRTHEMGLRAALGAGRGRLLRQMLTESLMLSSAAGVLGIVLAWFLLRALLRLNPGNIPRIEEASLDLPVLAFLIFITLLTGLLFGVLPSLTATRIHLVEFLKGDGRKGIVGARSKIRKGLAIAQLALVVVLLTCSGLLLRSFVNVLSEQTGFSASTVTANVQPNRGYNTAQKQRNLVNALLEGIKSIPGVEAVGMIDHLPLTDSESLSSVYVEGYPNEKNQLVEFRSVTPDYLAAMQIPMLAGRGFTESDGPRTAPITIVNEAFAKKYFGDQNPVGKQIRQGEQGPWSTVVGLIGDIHNEGLETSAEAQIYRPFLQNEDSEGVHNIAVRSNLPQDALVSAMRRAVHTVDPTLPLEDVHLMGELVSQASARRRFQTTLLTAFSGMALLLAVVGVYGLLAYSVRQRTGEIGIRMALGSSKSGVVRLILREGLTLLGVGLVIGVAAALACTRLLTGFLYGVTALDPVTFAMVPMLLLMATLAACLIPGLRAAAVDPVDALRHE